MIHHHHSHLGKVKEECSPDLVVGFLVRFDLKASHFLWLDLLPPLLFELEDERPENKM